MISAGSMVYVNDWSTAWITTFGVKAIDTSLSVHLLQQVTLWLEVNSEVVILAYVAWFNDMR
jgi:hypothetical protein